MNIQSQQLRSGLVQYRHFGRAAENGDFARARQHRPQKNDVLSLTIIGIFVLIYAASVAAWAELIWVIDCNPPGQADRTPELVQIIRSKAPRRPTLLL